MATGSSGQDAELTFVVSTNLRETQSAANKRRVRSAAALRSWDTRLAGIRKASDWTRVNGNTVKRATANGVPTRRLRREGASSVGAVDGLLSATVSADKPASPSASSVETVTAQKLTGKGVKRQHQEPPPHDGKDSSHPFHHYSPLPLSRVLLNDPSRHDADPEPEVPCICALCRAHQLNKEGVDGCFEQSRSEPRYALIETIARHDQMTASPSLDKACRVSDGVLDPFNCSPVPHKPWYDGILHHMLTVFAPRGWPALKITRAQGLRWEWFMTQHALAEPALFYVRLLFATGDLIRMNVVNPQVSYWLQSQAIQAINAALADPDRAVSDALILAVGRIALHESMYGDKGAAHTVHRPAQRRMIAMRGGLTNLDFPDLVKRLMLWADRVMSIQGGTERMLHGVGESQFTVKASLDVSEQWFPTEGRAIRTKVRTVNLVHWDAT